EIENNCKAFQKTLNSFVKIVTDEDVNELDVTRPSDDTNIGIKDFSLDNNIDLFFEKAINALINA
ncbi:8975_t:CDS:1, partial [Funneliformis geosporum]